MQTDAFLLASADVDSNAWHIFRFKSNHICVLSIVIARPSLQWHARTHTCSCRYTISVSAHELHVVSVLTLIARPMPPIGLHAHHSIRFVQIELHVVIWFQLRYIHSTSKPLIGMPLNYACAVTMPCIICIVTMPALRIVNIQGSQTPSKPSGWMCMMHHCICTMHL